MSDNTQAPEFRVWWIPQIPGNQFHFTVPDLDTGLLLCDALADYDMFQFNNRIKPDYANAGGVSYRHPELTEGEWHDIDIDSELADIRTALSEVSS